MDFDEISSIATALGVIVATWQIRESRKLAQATFEDAFNQQYRDLIYAIPVDALLGIELSESESKKIRELIFNYLDLCNEQISHCHYKRIGKKRWKVWADGIQENIHKPIFQDVWVEVKLSASDTFSFLERFEKEGFKSDPKGW
ncbi:hypothetical protein GLP22_08400 [Photobacterium carnosum]|uniref:hypothetical protein n=1 Tax=Photobacterium carnosum TaxID=2023717 RepID=UPI001E503055|nr:hypothetical protein [Photobacterium carnosum]MCD9541226.1 hypothetical protein [Photobacterium carnosum]